MWLPNVVAGLLALIYLSIKFQQWRARRRRLVQLVDRLPGPPNVPFVPLVNHALAIVYLDSLQHKMGTFALAYHLLLSMGVQWPKEGISRFWLGLKPVVMLFSAENVESILSSTSVINKSDEYGVFEPWIGEGLVTSKANKWRFRRKILTPAFHFRILNDFLPVMNQEATKLVHKLNRPKYLKPGTVVDLMPLIALCTLDTICETAMGVNINCQANEESAYVRALYEVGEMALSRVARPWLWFDTIFYLTEKGRRFTRANEIMHKFSTEVIIERKRAWESQLYGTNEKGNEPQPDDTTNEDSARQREPSSNQKNDKHTVEVTKKMTFDDLRASSFFAKGNNKRLAFLDLMLHQHLIDKTMSIDDIREEVDTFMFAGHDTTAMNISWALYMLGLHQDIQAKAREEVDRVIGTDKLPPRQQDGLDCRPDASATESKHLHDDNVSPSDASQTGSEQDRAPSWLAAKLDTTDITNEHLRELKYLERVIKETLRMWPSIPFVARQMTEDLTVGGATCMIFTQLLHNNPRHFPKPERFDPDRFLPECSAQRHPFAYIPFSAGPRNCIGQKFAQMEVKVILAKIIKNYLIRTYDHRDKLAVVGELVLRPRNGLNVCLEPRFKGQ